VDRHGGNTKCILDLCLTYPVSVEDGKIINAKFNPLNPSKYGKEQRRLQGSRKWARAGSL